MLALIQYDWCHYKKRKFGHTQRGYHLKTQWGNDYLQANDRASIETNLLTL